MIWFVLSVAALVTLVILWERERFRCAELRESLERLDKDYGALNTEYVKYTSEWNREKQTMAVAAALAKERLEAAGIFELPAVPARYSGSKIAYKPSTPRKNKTRIQK